MARDTETFITANVAPVRISALGGPERFPRDCPHCREKVTSWPLGVYHNRVGLICPHCFTIAARVEIVEGGPDDDCICCQSGCEGGPAGAVCGNCGHMQTGATW